jgi:hypothetical protein
VSVTTGTRPQKNPPEKGKWKMQLLKKVGNKFAKKNLSDELIKGLQTTNALKNPKSKKYLDYNNPDNFENVPLNILRQVMEKPLFICAYEKLGGSDPITQDPFSHATLDADQCIIRILVYCLSATRNGEHFYEIAKFCAENKIINTAFRGVCTKYPNHPDDYPDILRRMVWTALDKAYDQMPQKKPIDKAFILARTLNKNNFTSYIIGKSNTEFVYDFTTKLFKDVHGPHEVYTILSMSRLLSDVEYSQEMEDFFGTEPSEVKQVVRQCCKFINPPFEHNE